MSTIPQLTTGPNPRFLEHGVRYPSQDAYENSHDCLFCGAYVNTECAQCGDLIMSMIPGNDAFNCAMDVCYKCELIIYGLI